MRRRVVLGVVVTGVVAAGGAGFALRPPAAGPDSSEPAPAPEVATANPDGSVHHEVELVARSVDLTHLGVHTHANWVVFELPFDVDDPSVHHVHFAPRATTDTAIGALRTRFGCLRTRAVGPVTSGAISKFTKNGVDDTSRFDEHSLAPTTSARAYAINIPTRLANAAACWRPALARPETWRLRVFWDTR